MSIRIPVLRVRPKAPASRVDSMLETGTGAIADISGITGPSGVGNVAVDSGDVCRITAELDFVKEVEKLHAELERNSFGDFEILVEREVCVGNSRPRTITD